MNSQTSSSPTPPRGDSRGAPTRALHPDIEPLFRRLGDLCSLPTVAMEVIRVANDPEAEVADLRAVVERDPAVATRLMKVVNSSHSGLRTGIADLKSAVSLLGIDRVRNLALTASLGAAFGRPTPLGVLDPQRLWDHSVATAALARLVAERSGVVPSEEAYLAGLLHDLGLVFMQQQLEEPTHLVLVRVSMGEPMIDSEQAVLAFDHAQLGAYVTWRAGLPDRTVLAIEHHHDPSACPDEGADLARCVAAGNYLATRAGRGSIEGRRLPPPAYETFAPLGLDTAALSELWAEAPEALGAVAELARL